MIPSFSNNDLFTKLSASWSVSYVYIAGYCNTTFYSEIAVVTIVFKYKIL